MKRILVVDDEPVVRALAEESLRRGDWSVQSAGDAAAALAAIRRERPDLILLDLGLPGTSGAELARRLREDERTRTIPIVYMTGLRPADCEGADGVVTKPFTPERLRAYASNWL